MKVELRALLMQCLLAPWHNILRPANDGLMNTVEFMHQVIQADTVGFQLGSLDVKLLGVHHLATLPLSLNCPMIIIFSLPSFQLPLGQNPVERKMRTEYLTQFL